MSGVPVLEALDEMLSQAGPYEMPEEMWGFPIFLSSPLNV